LSSLEAKTFLQEKGVEATKQKQRRKEGGKTLEATVESFTVHSYKKIYIREYHKNPYHPHCTAIYWSNSAKQSQVITANSANFLRSPSEAHCSADTLPLISSTLAQHELQPSYISS
jgi:hypothetical protein